MLASVCATRCKNIGLFAVIISAFFLLGLAASAAPNKSLYSLIPLESPVTASVDVPWLWQSTTNFRRNDAVSNGLHAAEAALGLSFEHDVLPWAGQAAFAVTDVRQDGPAWALFLQIRAADHMLGSARVEALLQTMLGGRSSVTWAAMDYKGVAIRHTEIHQGRSVVKIATATLDGWLIITFGDGVIRKVIDTRNGDTPSLETHPAFARAMGRLPAGAGGQFCINGHGMLAQLQQHDAGAARRLQDTELGKSFLAGALTYPGDNLQLDTIYCSLSPKTQATLKQLRADVGTVSGASLAQLPEGTFATLLISNPDKWVGAVQQLLLDAAGDADARNKIMQGFASIDGLRGVLKCCTGELGVGIAWRDGNGIGVSLAGQTGTTDNATAAAADFSSFLEKLHLQVEQQHSLYTLPVTKGGGGIFHTLLCWTTRGQWLLAASHPTWITQPAATPSLVLPASANDVNLAAFGDFSFLPSLMKSMGADDTVLAKYAPMWRGQWAFAMKIDEDGGAVRSQISGSLPMLATTAAVLFPVMAKARDKARETASFNNLRQLAIATMIYEQDNDRLPVLKTEADIAKQLNVLAPALISPRTQEPYTPNPFVFGKAPGIIADPETMIIFYEKTAGPDGSRCAAFLDGHVVAIPASEWEAAKRRAKIP